MTSCTYGCLRNVINLGNSIIGVSILAMPYCFQKCGILLSLFLIVVTGILVRTACYLLLKGAIMARRRNFEFLAFHALGSSGKLVVEIGIIGFLIGVCIAFFVVIGDLGPTLAAKYFSVENNSNLRAEVLIFLGAFVVLPLGLLRKVDSLTSLSFLSIGFYVCLVLKIFAESSSKLVSGDWINEVNWWNFDGLLPCLPIFSMALSCQTQLFEFFDTLSEPSLKRMTSVVNGAVCLCSTVYISVGVFGYLACHDKDITGNILVNLTPSVLTEFIKLGFIATVVISFPLCLFPCRTSLHSLLFKQGLGHHDFAVDFIPDYRFRVLTITLVVITVGVAIMLPNIEFVLSIIGSTIGSTICFILPAVIFIQDSNKNMSEKRIAQVVLFVGMFILLACTYSTLREGTRSRSDNSASKVLPVLSENADVQHLSAELTHSSSLPHSSSHSDVDNLNILHKTEKVKIVEDQNEKRQEPPEPRDNEIPKIEGKKFVVPQAPATADIDPQALQKEDKEIQKESLRIEVTPAKSLDSVALKNKQEQLLRQLEEQQKEQQIILQQQKQVLEELKMHKETHDTAAKEEVIKAEEKQNNLKNDVLNLHVGSNVHEKKSINSSQKQNIPVMPVQINSPLPPKQSVLNAELKENAPLINLNFKNNSVAENIPKVPPDIKSGNIIVNKHLNVPQDPVMNKVNDRSVIKNISVMDGNVPNLAKENKQEFKPLNPENVQPQPPNVPSFIGNNPKQNIESHNLIVNNINKGQQQQSFHQHPDNHSINKINMTPAYSDNKKPEMR